MHKVELLDVINHLLNAECAQWSMLCPSPCSTPEQHSSSSSPLIATACKSNENRRQIRKTFLNVIGKGGTVADIYDYFLALNPLRPTIDAQGKVSSTIFKTIQDKPRKLWNSFQRSRIKQTAPQNKELSKRDEQVFKHAVLCAQCLLLCGPDAPPTVSPMVQGGGESLQSNGLQEMGEPSHSSSNNDLHDSPDNISIAQETLFSLLRNAFGVNMAAHKRILAEVKEMTSQAGGRARLLLKDLWDHRLRIEYNDHKFYRARSFQNVDCYAKWRQNEIARYDRLIEKVTGHQQSSISQGEARLITFNGHEEYEILQDKLFRQEMKTRKEVVNDNDNYVVSPSVFSTASKRLLKEFALRFGVGRSFRKITEFACMARNFEVNNWYMKCTVEALDRLMELVNEEHECIVSNELQILRMVLEELHNNLEYNFVKIKSLCPRVMQYSGVHTLVEVLGMVLDAEIVLGLRDDEGSTLRNLLEEYVKTAVRREYRRCREIIFADTSSSLEDDKISPKSLQLLINDMRGIMKYFTQLERETGAFNRYININRVVAKALYEMFMLDVKELCVERTVDIITDSIDAEMYKLAFRLAKLDQDWAQFIPCREQKWRTYYVLESRVIMSCIGDYLNRMVKQFMLNDTWRKIDCVVEDAEQASPSSSGTPNAMSPASLIPSRTSAFSAIESAATSPVAVEQGTSRQSESSAAEGRGLYQEIPGFSEPSSVQLTEEDGLSVDEEVAQYSMPKTTSWTRMLGGSSLISQPKAVRASAPCPGGFRFNYHSDSKILERAYTISHRLEKPKYVDTEQQRDGNSSRFKRFNSLSNLHSLASISTRIEGYAKDDFLVSYSAVGAPQKMKRYEYLQTSDICESSGISDDVLHGLQREGKVLRKSRSTPFLLHHSKLHRCNTHTDPDSSDPSACNLFSSWSRSSFSPKFRTPNQCDPFESLGPGTKIDCFFTSSIVDLLVAIKRYCAVTADLVSLLIPPTEVDTDGRDALIIRSQLRNEFFDRYMRAVGDILTTYAQGLMTMDLCGIGRSVMSFQDKKHLIRQQEDGLLLGCRHEPMRRYYSDSGKEFCPTYRRIKKFYPAEWEPVSVAMCNRLNNLWALMDILPALHKMGGKILTGTDVDFTKNNQQDVPHDMCSELKLCAEQLHQYFRIMMICIAFRTFAMYSSLLDSLFYLDLPCVKYLRRRRASFGDQMMPVYLFISSKARMFKTELAPDCSKRVIKELWGMIVDDFHRRIKELWNNAIDATFKAKEIIILLPVLLNAVNCFDDKKFSESLMELSEPVLFRAELYTMSCERLGVIYDNLDSRNDIDMHHYSNDEILVLLKRKLPASFTGQEFYRIMLQDIDWLNFIIEKIGFSCAKEDYMTAVTFGNYLLSEDLVECKEIPDEYKKPQGVAIVSPKAPRKPVVVVGGKRMAMPRFNSEESLGSDGSDTRPATSLSVLEEENPYQIMYDSDRSEYLLSPFGDWRRNMIARLLLLCRRNFSDVDLFKEDIKQVLVFRCFVRQDTKAWNLLLQVDPTFNIPRPISCPCL